MKEKVLYIEDEKNLRDLVLKVLEKSGYATLGADDGLSGIKAAFAEIPDLILLDLNLPTMSGWEVITKLQGDEKLRNIPIVVLTGDTDGEGREKSLIAGSSGYLNKPLNLKELPGIIADFIKGKKHEIVVSTEKKEDYLREHSLRLVDRLYEQIENLTATNQKMKELNSELVRRDAYIENMLDPLWVLDLDGNTVDFNRALEDFLSCDADILRSSNVSDFLDEENRKIVENEDKARASEQSSSSYQLTFTDAKGRKREVIISGHPVLQGVMLIGTFALIKDISDRKLLEEKYKHIFENTNEGLYQSSIDGKLITANPALVNILGYDSREELSKRDLKESIYSGIENWEEYLDLLFENKSVLNHEMQYKKRNGEEIIVVSSSRLVTDEFGGEPYIAGSLSDITERRKIEKERETFTLALKEKNTQLKEANLLKDEFLANMSHELRTPLNSIIGFSEVLVDGLSGELNEEQTEFMNNIRSSGMHLLELINNILDLSKIRAGMMTINPSPVDLVSLSREVCGTFIPQATQRQISCTSNLPDYELVAILDPLKIKQVLINIMGNAFKFSHEKGKVKLTVKEIMISDWDKREMTPARPGEGNAVAILVEDTGIGIKNEDVDIIFDEFSQIDGSYTRETGGSGLGLPISKKFILLHGGKIWAESEPGTSTRITIILPKKPSKSTDEEYLSGSVEGEIEIESEVIA